MKGLGWFMAIVGTIALIIVIVIAVSRWYSFYNEIGDYLKLAGDAPTVEKADSFLGTALNAIEHRGLTSGNSAFIFHKPNADLGIWYNQIKGAKETTATVLKRASTDPGSLTQLERDNALMKIREVVLDNSSGGITVTTPPNITWYPQQWGILMGIIISAIILVIGVVLLLVAFDSGH